MPPGKLDASILLAIGLSATAGCGEKDTGETGPCLDYATETGETGPCLDYATDTGPCLTPPEDTGETGPCLDYPTDTGDPGDTGDTSGGGDGGGEGRSDAARRVLDRGVLPDDVAKLLRKRRSK